MCRLRLGSGPLSLALVAAAPFLAWAAAVRGPVSQAQSPPGGAGAAASPVRAVVPGSAQDGGAPHRGCRQELCVRARFRVAREGRELPL